jgi:hypothetical protein
MIGLGGSVTSGITPELKFSAAFDGANDFFHCGPSSNAIAHGASEVSAMFWIKVESTYDIPSSTPYVFSVQRKQGSSSFACTITTSGKVSAPMRKTALEVDDGWSVPRSTTSINDDAWHHVALTGKANEQKVYIDGVREITHTEDFVMDTNGAAHSTDPSFIIGGLSRLTSDSNNDGLKDGRFLKCRISELAIFNTVLTPSEIQAAYNNPGINLNLNQHGYNSSSNLTAYYRMGNGFLDEWRYRPEYFSNSSIEQEIIANQSKLDVNGNANSLLLEPNQSVDINTTNWEVNSGTSHLNGQTPIGNGVITYDGSQTHFTQCRPKSGLYNPTVAGEIYRIEVHYTRSDGTVQVKCSGDENTDSGISLNPPLNTQLYSDLIGIGYVRATSAQWGVTFNASFIGTVTKVILQKLTPNNSAIVKNSVAKSILIP